MLYATEKNELMLLLSVAIALAAIGCAKRDEANVTQATLGAW